LFFYPLSAVILNSTIIKAMNRIEIGSSYMRSVHSRMLEALNIDKGQFIISERTLRAEQVLAANKNTYNFDLKENKSSDRPLERKLNQNDGFVISHLGLAIYKETTSGSPTQYFPLFTYPDPNYFLGVLGGINESDSAETLYLGDLSLKSNNTEIIQQFNTMHLRYVPERGYIVAAGAQTRDEFPQYGPSIEARGFYPYSVNAILNGQDNNTLSLSVGAGNTTVIGGGVNAAGGAVTTRNVAALLVHGFEIAEAAQSGLRWGTF